MSNINNCFRYVQSWMSMSQWLIKISLLTHDLIIYSAVKSERRIVEAKWISFNCPRFLTSSIKACLKILPASDKTLHRKRLKSNILLEQDQRQTRKVDVFQADNSLDFKKNDQEQNQGTAVFMAQWLV